MTILRDVQRKEKLSSQTINNSVVASSLLPLAFHCDSSPWKLMLSGLGSNVDASLRKNEEQETNLGGLSTRPRNGKKSEHY